MIPFIVVDSGPLGLLTQRIGAPNADACRAWLEGHSTRGTTVVLPEVVDYELRRELLRARKTASVRRLDVFIAAPGVLYLPITTVAMRRAAELWAQLRNQGQPTADPRALDADVILAAQVLTAGLPLADVVVATTNVAHLDRMLTARLWSQIV